MPTMRKIIRFILIIVSIGMMAFSGYKLLNIYIEYGTADKLYNDYADEFVHDHNNEKEKVPIHVDFDSLLNENKDIVAWIYSENTPINYPIVQSTDNSYYLYRMLDGSDNKAGSIFMDYRNSSNVTDFNTIIYGHNMKNDTMFGTLLKYKNQEYFETHPVIYLITPMQTYEVEIIFGYVTDVSSKIYDISQTTEEKKTILEEITQKSNFAVKPLFQEDDRLLTLSTCSYETDTSRYVLVGKILDN